MSRPVKCRKVCCLPMSNSFSPSDTNYSESSTVFMTVDEYETIRLIDYRGFSQEECARQMNVARTTAQSIYLEARKKLSDCLVNGKALKIEGGSYKLCDGIEHKCRYGGCKRHSLNDTEAADIGIL